MSKEEGVFRPELPSGMGSKASLDAGRSTVPAGIAGLSLLSGPAIPLRVCPLCEGRKVFALNPVRAPRECICCQGTGLYADPRFNDPTEARAYELGLHPRRHPSRTA